jgi:sec-independent protein translocase protein TatA
MIGDLFDSPWKVLIVAVVLIVLFGSKKMPDAARSLGRSMRILKAEVSNLHPDEESTDRTAVTDPAEAKRRGYDPEYVAWLEKQAQEAPAQATPTPALAAPHEQQIEQLQQQIRDLQQQQSAAGGATTVDGAPLAEAQRTQRFG